MSNARNNNSSKCSARNNKANARNNNRSQNRANNSSARNSESK